MKTVHIVPGTSDISNGMVVVAKLLAGEQGNAGVVDLKRGSHRIHQEVKEVWVHGAWLPREWLVCWWALRAGKRLVRMTHGSLSPIYLKHQSPLKKRLVGPIERFFLRRADVVVATCQTEAEWIRAYEPKVKRIEIMDIKQFFDLSHKEHKEHKKGEPLHLLYLGRRHPLKGVEYLEAAVRQIQESTCSLQLKVVSDAFGEEKEKVWDWCDVLVLPSLSENFGLVVAEALERGKRVITTDGAPAWGDGNDYGGRLIYIKGYRDGSNEERVRLLKEALEGLVGSR